MKLVTLKVSLTTQLLLLKNMEVEGLNITKIVKLIHKVKNLIYNIPAGTSCKMA